MQPHCYGVRAGCHAHHDLTVEPPGETSSPRPWVNRIAGPSIDGRQRAMSNGSRDVERVYSTTAVVAKLRRLADALEKGTPFPIQVAEERIRVPARAEFSIEHEHSMDEEEIEFQLKWNIDEEKPAPREEEPLV